MQNANYMTKLIFGLHLKYVDSVLHGTAVQFNAVYISDNILQKVVCLLIEDTEKRL